MFAGDLDVLIRLARVSYQELVVFLALTVGGRKASGGHTLDHLDQAAVPRTRI